MTARLLVIDSGGTARQLARLIVVDSGGTSRVLKRLFAIDAGGVARKVFQAALQLVSRTVTAVGTDGANNGYYDATFGGGSGIGTIDANTFTDPDGNARTIAGVYHSTVPSDATTFALTGTVPNTDSTFRAIRIGGGAELLRSAATYTTPAGYSKWTWLGTGDTFVSAPKSVAVWS